MLLRYLPNNFFFTCEAATSTTPRVRFGRRTNSPEQFGHTCSIASVHVSQNVHSYEQMNAVSVAGNPAPQRSHFPFIFSIGLSPFGSRSFLTYQWYVRYYRFVNRNPNITMTTATLPSRREENAEATREALLNEAGKLFVRNGFASTSLAEITEKARVTKGALYHHFASKEDLFAACYNRQAARVADIIRAVPTTNDPWQDTLAGCRAFLDIATTKGLRTISIQEAATVLGWKRWREIDSAHTMGSLVQTISRTRAAGIPKEYDPQPSADVIYGLLVNAMMSLSMSADKAAAKETLLRLVEDMLSGLRAQ